jgi:UDP-2,3-diacylglucosamine pyrophosphatase LpxH
MTIQLRYISDLHLEFIKPKKFIKLIKKLQPNSFDEILVLAGDICANPYSEIFDIFMEYVNNTFCKIFYITGNHEYYHGNKTVHEINEYLIEYFKKYSNITFLNNSYEFYNGYYFIGCTLWSHVKDLKYKINDVVLIKNLNFQEYNNLNQICIDFLQNTLTNNKLDKVIIITHHLPSEQLIDPKYLTPIMKPYNSWFFCDMDNFIEKYKDKIKCWFYGHTHTSSCKYIHNIPFLCNPIGYPGENKNNDFNKVLKL